MKVPYGYAAPLDGVSDNYLRVFRTRRDELRARMTALPLDRDNYDLEIGCGHGHFLAAYAEAHPGRYCLGVDVAGARLERARRKTDRAGLDNITWIQAEALLLLENLPAGIAFSRVFILFPDPWPKRRHHKHRLVQPRFLELLSSVCRPEAMLYFRSDNRDYTARTREALSTSPFWDLVSGEAWPWERATVFQELASGYQSLVGRKKTTGWLNPGN